MKRQLGIIALLFVANSMLAQVVDRVVFERGVNYINCQLTKIALSEQAGKPHLTAYNKEVGNHNCSFENVVVFLKTRPTGVMIENLELAYFIDSYKDKYNETLTNAELYSILKNELFKEAMLQNFKIKHEAAFANFEILVNDYLINLFRLKETVTETIDDNWGDIVMVEEGSEPSNNTNNKIVDTVTQDKGSTEEQTRPRRVFTPFDFGEDEEIFSFSSWFFRFSLLFASLAVLLYVLLPYYEKREKAKVKKTGDEIHPQALSLAAEIAILENKNRILRQEIEKMHLDLDDYEDTFRSI